MHDDLLSREALVDAHKPVMSKGRFAGKLQRAFGYGKIPKTTEKANVRSSQQEDCQGPLVSSLTGLNMEEMATRLLQDVEGSVHRDPDRSPRHSKSRQSRINQITYAQSDVGVRSCFQGFWRAEA